MTRKARLWIGGTLLLVIALNYILIGIPLIKRELSLREKTRSIVMSKSGGDEFVLELFRKESIAVRKRQDMLNGISLSLAVIVASWTLFGLVFGKKK
jgi:hypothetical protein